MHNTYCNSSLSGLPGWAGLFLKDIELVGYIVYSEAKASVPGISNKLGEWLSDWLSTQFFSAG